MQVTTFPNKEAAQQAAEAFNKKFIGANYHVTFVGPNVVAHMKVPRMGYYVVNPWGKLV